MDVLQSFLEIDWVTKAQEDSYLYLSRDGSRYCLDISIRRVYLTLSSCMILEDVDISSRYYTRSL